jgi:hypothetical protein
MVMSRKRKRRLARRGEVDPVTNEKLYRLSSLASAAEVDLRTVQNHVKKGLIKVRRVGPYGHPRVSESEFRKYVGLDSIPDTGDEKRATRRNETKSTD